MSKLSFAPIIVVLIFCAAAGAGNPDERGVLEGVELNSSFGSFEPVESGKFVAWGKDGKIYLEANEADTKQVLEAIARLIGVDLILESQLQETTSLMLLGVSPERAIRQAAKSYVLQFKKSKRNGLIQLEAIKAVPRPTGCVAIAAMEPSSLQTLGTIPTIYSGQ